MSHKAILIIEDDAAIREALQQIYGGEGYTVILAENGKQALEILFLSSTEMPALILVDYMMPVMDGPLFLQELKLRFPKIYSETPIFIITAGNEASKLTSKVTGILKKPFDINELYKVGKMYCEDI